MVSITAGMVGGWSAIPFSFVLRCMRSCVEEPFWRKSDSAVLQVSVRLSASMLHDNGLYYRSAKDWPLPPEHGGPEWADFAWHYKAQPRTIQHGQTTWKLVKSFSNPPCAQHTYIWKTVWPARYEYIWKTWDWEQEGPDGLWALWGVLEGKWVIDEVWYRFKQTRTLCLVEPPDNDQDEDESTSPRPNRRERRERCQRSSKVGPRPRHNKPY